VLTDPGEIRNPIWESQGPSEYNKATALRRFAPRNMCSTTSLPDVEIVATRMPNLGYRSGSRLNVRITHISSMRDGKIRREIAYEGFRKWGGPTDVGNRYRGAEVTIYDAARA